MSFFLKNHKYAISLNLNSFNCFFNSAMIAFKNVIKLSDEYLNFAYSENCRKNISVYILGLYGNLYFSFMRIVDMAFGAQEGTEYSFDFYFQAIIAGNYMIRDVLSREVLEIDYLDQSRYNAKVINSYKKGLHN